MSSAIDDDDLDDEEPLQQPAYVGRRRSFGGTTGSLYDADKSEAEARARMDAAQRRQRLWRTVICGALLITFVCVLTFITAKTLLAPEPDLPFTNVVRKTIATHSQNNASESVSTSNKSGAELDAFGYAMPSSDTDVQSGPLPVNFADANLFCGTEDCKNFALFLNDLLSPRPDKCGSLYDQVCSRWARSHERLAETRGRYSVDEAVLDAYRQQVSRVLLDPSLPLADQRSFYTDCVNGSLFTEQDMLDITNEIMLHDEGWTPETFAKAVAKMSRIGVSPFFDISVEASNGVLSVNLRPLDADAVRKYRFYDDRGESWSNYHKKNFSSYNLENVENSTSVAFLLALERFMCQEVTEMSHLNWSCVMTADLSLQASWRYEWCTSTGPTLLAESIASMLEELSVYNKALEEKQEMFTSFHVTPASEEERTTRCLRFLDQYDLDLIPHLIITYISPRIQDAAQKIFTPLKATLNRAMPNASTIGIAFIHPGVSNDSSFLYKHSADLYGSQTVFNVSRLRKFLINSTWKRWTGAFTLDTPSLSTIPTLCRDHSAVQVPPGVFNLTRVPDKWLLDLSLARVGPRFLRSAFSLPYLSRQLNKTQFSQCVSGLVKLQHTVGGSRVSGHGEGPRWFAGSGIAHRDIENPDLEEMASFYLSLQTYRALVGESVAVPGTVLNSDSLFLLYYAFDNCQVEVGSEATETVRQSPLYAREFRYRGTQDDSSDRRRRVDSVAAMFGGLLLEKCQQITDLSACEMESEEQF